MNNRDEARRKIARIGAIGGAAAVASLVIAWKIWKWHVFSLPFEPSCWPPLSPTRWDCVPHAALAIIAIACALFAAGAFVVAGIHAWRARARGE